MLILVVEDDARVARFITRGLGEEGYQVDVCTRGDEAAEQGLASPYDLILLDWGLPGQDGLTVLRHWRLRGVQCPIIMLTARAGTDPLVLALDAGADDYVEKPFSFEALLARIRAHLRRRLEHPTSLVHLGDTILDLRRRTLTRSGTMVELSSREFALLDLLLRHRGDVVSRTRILDRVWGVAHDPSSNVVEVYIRYLRVKLDGESPAVASLIETVRGRGYRLRTDDEVVASQGPGPDDET